MPRKIASKSGYFDAAASRAGTRRMLGGEAHFRRAGKQDDGVLLRRRRQALPEQGRLCRGEAARSTRGETRRACATIGADGKPCLRKTGSPGAEPVRRAGKRTSVSYFGKDGKPCPIKDGTRKQSALSTSGKQDERCFFGVDGKPCLHKDGDADGRPPRRTRKRDDHVLPRRRRQALPDQGRTRRSEGGLRRAGKRDKPLLLRRRRQALPDQRRVLGGEAHVRRARKRDMRVLLCRRRQALLEQGRVAGWKAQFNERGNETSAFYFGVDGNPCPHKDGNAAWKTAYDGAET